MSDSAINSRFDKAGSIELDHKVERKESHIMKRLLKVSRTPRKEDFSVLYEIVSKP